MTSRCVCRTQKGTRCKKSTKEGSKFCWIHQGCKTVVGEAKKAVKDKTKAKTETKVKTKTKAKAKTETKVKTKTKAKTCDKYKLVDLKKMAADAKIKGRSKMIKGRLCRALEIPMWYEVEPTN